MPPRLVFFNLSNHTSFFSLRLLTLSFPHHILDLEFAKLLNSIPPDKRAYPAPFSLPEPTQEYQFFSSFLLIGSLPCTVYMSNWFFSVTL